jgi:hypothetical protein
MFTSVPFEGLRIRRRYRKKWNGSNMKWVHNIIRTGAIWVGRRGNFNGVPKYKPESPRCNDTSNAKFLFVRGFMRSGTNWVGNLLNLHPKISCSGEFYFDEIQAVRDKLIQSGYSLLSHPVVKKAADECFEEFIKTCIMSAGNLKKKKNVIWYGDRTPRDIEPILVSGGRYFLVIRDPRDIIVSWAYHLLRLKLSGNNLTKVVKMS